MSRVIRISEAIFRRLQKLAIPLEDTPASVIQRLLDFHDSHQDRDVKKTSYPIGQAQPLRTDRFEKQGDETSLLSRVPRQRGVSIEIDGNGFTADSLADLYGQVLRFLADNAHLAKLKPHLPVSTSSKRYFVAAKPFHPNGNEFVRPVEYQGFFMESHKDYKNGINHLRKILDLCGLTLVYVG